jgi:[ribosomal protein S5]-alanine N-acetyltransferase
MFLTTARLRLIPGTRKVLEADLRGRLQLQLALGVTVPANWPPQFYDQDAIDYTLRNLQADERTNEWPLYYIELRQSNPSVIVGIAGYKGPPAADGSVEIGYSILAQYQRNGYATEASQALVDAAFLDPDVKRVAAETYPVLVPSVRVMEKCGLEYVGPGSEEGVVRYEINSVKNGALGLPITE